MNLDDLISETGQFGLFQLTLVVFIFGSRLVFAWSMTMMSFAKVPPDWWCVEPEVPAGLTPNETRRDNTTFAFCTTNDSSTCIPDYDDKYNTVVNEWNLVCDMEYVVPLMTSIQMAGVLVGALAGGQSSDTVGRKKTYFITLLLGAASNIIAAFSVSWQMFTVLRFFIGFSVGSYLAVSYIYVIEFLGSKYRSIMASVPLWVIGVSIFACASWLRPDWFYQHVIVGVLHIPYLFGWFLVPESLRWLTVRGHVEEAERVVEQMCRYNRKRKPTNTAQVIQQVALEEQGIRRTAKKYTYIDIYKGWTLFYKSVIIQFVWTSMSLLYYGMTFGVSSLTGNLFLNIFLLGIVEIPGSFTIHILSNRIGRRFVSFVYLVLATAAAFGVVLSSIYVGENHRGTAIQVLALITKLGVGTAWSTVMITTTETYPTVIRNLGNGAANTMARVGGIVAPYLFVMKKGEVLVPFSIVGSVCGACALLVLLLGETKGIALQDTLTAGKRQPSENVPKNVAEKPKENNMNSTKL